MKRDRFRFLFFLTASGEDGMMLYMDEKEMRIVTASRYIAKLKEYSEKVSSSEVRSSLEKISRNLRDLKDTQVLFDSGEKELIRLYDRYIPYLFEILDQYLILEESGNYDAIVRSRKQLLEMLGRMDRAITTVRGILPQDEIDEANARAKADQMRKKLDEKHRNMVK